MIHLVNEAHAGIISDAPRISEVLGNTFSFLLSILGVFAIIALVVVGIIYLTAGGNEKRTALAKKATVYSIIGILIALGAMVIIRTIAEFLS